MYNAHISACIGFFWNKFHAAECCTPSFFPAELGFSHSLSHAHLLSFSVSSPLPLFILLRHCPSSATYLMLFTDSLQPCTLLFLKEKELKLAGEMNNVAAINSGMEVSVFSCVRVGGVMRWGKRRKLGGVDSGPALYAPFRLLHRLQKRRNDFCMEISPHSLRRLV